MDESIPGKKRAPDPPTQVHHGQQSHSDDVTQSAGASGKGPVAAPRLSKQSKPQKRPNKNTEPLRERDVKTVRHQQRNTMACSGASGSGSETSQDQDTLPSHEPIDSYIHSAWDRLNFEVSCHEQATIQFDATNFITPPCKLQFALDSAEMGDEIKELLESKDIIYTEAEGRLCFVYKEPKFDWQEIVVKESLLGMLKSNVVQDIDCISIKTGAVSDKELRDKVRKNIPVILKKGKIMIFRSGNNMHIVGNSSTLKLFCEQTGWKSRPEMDIKEIVLNNLNQDDIKCIKTFEFHTDIRTSVPEITLQLTGIPKITGPAEGIQKAKLALQTLMKSLVHREVIFRQPQISLALTDKNGQPNDALCELIKRQICNKELFKVRKCHVEIRRGQLPKMIVYCGNESEAEIAAKTASEYLGFYKMDKTVLKLNSSLIENLMHRNQLFMLPADGDLVEYVASDEVHDELTTKLVVTATESVKSNPLVTALLKHHGTKVLNEIQRNYRVVIEVGEDIINLTGIKTDIGLAKGVLKKSFFTKHFPVPTNNKHKERIISECVEIEEKYTCICKLKHKESRDPDSNKVKNGRYHTAWLRPITAAKLTVIEGVAGEMDFDALILPTNDSFFPVIPMEHFTKRGLESIVMLAGKIRSNFGKPHKAEIGFYGKDTYDFGSKEVLFFVVSDTCRSDEKDWDFIDSSVGQKFMSNSFGKANKTVGMPVDLLKHKGGVTAESFIHRIVSLWKNTWSNNVGFPEIFLCTSESSTAVVQTVSEVFVGSTGFAKRTYDSSADAETFKKDSPVELKVVIGNLYEIKADVIVNTTGPALDLDKGIISSLITKHAGRSVQAECKSNYPNGLTNHQVAVTGAGNLQIKSGIKKIFHIALSRTVSAVNSQSVKDFVRRCLYTAETLPDDLKSIAFPALGTGNLGYARRDVAAAMFEAATEFIDEALYPRLKNICFVLYEKDIETCQAFDNVFKRRKIKTEVVPRETDQECLTATIHGETNQVELVVGVELFCPPPSFVELNFSSEMSGFSGGQMTKFDIKEATSYPERQNDVIYAEIKASSVHEELFTSVVKEVLKYTEENRITGLYVFPFISPDCKCPVGKQVAIIAGAIQVTSPLKYLNKVWFKVDAAGFMNVEEHNYKEADDSFINSLLRRVSFSKLIWQRAPLRMEQSVATASIEIVGLSEDRVEEAAKSLTDKIQAIVRGEPNKVPALKHQDRTATASVTLSEETYRKHGAIPKKREIKDTAAHIERPRMAKEAGMGTETESWFEVTAKVNQGIIGFLEKNERLGNWKSEVTDRFKIIFDTKGHQFSARGSFEAVKSFNDYLVDTFQSDSLKDDNIEMNDKPKVIETKSADEEDKKTDEANVGREVDSSGDISGQAVNCNIYQYLIGGICAKVYETDLTKLKINCIVSSVSPNLSGKFGISLAIEKAAGTRFREECKSEVKKNGKLQNCEIRLTGAGNLNCDSVIHVYIAEEKDGQRHDNIQRAVSACLKEAECRHFTSIAFPFLGTGIYQLRLKDLASICSRALRDFSAGRSKSSYIKDVHFVDREREHIREFTGSLQEYFQSLRFNNTHIISAKGNVTATKVDACVVIEDDDFSGTGTMSRQVALLSGDNYIKDFDELKKKTACIGDVLFTKARSQMAQTCKYVLHAVSPQRNLEYTSSTTQFERDIKLTLMNVLNRCEELNVDSVAIPMFGRSAFEKKIPTPYAVCCRCMVSTIEEFLSTNRNTCVRKIQLLDFEETIVSEFTKSIHEVFLK